MNDLHAKVESHDKRLSLMEDNTNRTNASLEANTKAVGQLVTQLAVYISKHDSIEDEVKGIRDTQVMHGEDIAAMRPVVDGMRGLVWKLAASVLLGAGGVAAMFMGVAKVATG